MCVRALGNARGGAPIGMLGLLCYRGPGRKKLGRNAAGWGYPGGEDSLWADPATVLFLKACDDLLVELEVGRVDHAVKPEELLLLGEVLNADV